jgi:hypothetical protein
VLEPVEDDLDAFPTVKREQAMAEIENGKSPFSAPAEPCASS